MEISREKCKKINKEKISFKSHLTTLTRWARKSDIIAEKILFFKNTYKGSMLELKLNLNY